MHPDTPDRISPRTRRSLVRLLVFPAYLLILVELMARLAVGVSGVVLDSSYGYPPDIFQEHPTRGYSYVEGFQGHFPNANFSDIPISINSDGFRDRDFVVDKSDHRILVLGDSITFGAGIAASDRYTEEISRQICPNNRCVVMNLGVNGYQIGNYEAVLNEQISRLKPDLVIIGFCMNDIQTAATVDQVAKARRAGWIETLRGVLAHSVAMRLVARQLRSASWDAEQYRHSWIEKATRAWSSEENEVELAATLVRLKLRARQANARTIAIIFPERSQLEDFARWGSSYEAAARIFGDVQIPFVSGRTVLLGNPRSNEPGFIDSAYLPGDNVHFTPDAHRTFGRALASLIDELSVDSSAKGSDQRN